MKALPTLLVCSLAANIALVGVCLSRPDWVVRTAASLHLGPARVASPPAPKPASAFKSMPGAGIWDQFDSGNIADAIARMRAAGFPEKIIRSIAWGLLTDKYRIKRNAVLADMKPMPYWKTMGWQLTQKNFQPALAKLGREQQDDERALGLIDDSDPDVLRDLNKARLYGDLPKETVSKIEKIQSDYGEMQQELYAEHPGVWTKDMAVKQAYLEKQKQADLAQTLTPDELETYQLHSGGVAQNVQAKLQYFDASEAEYKAIFDAQQPVLATAMIPRMTGMTPEEQAQQQQAQAAAEQQIAAALGPDRYAEYQKDTSPVYAQTAQALTPLDVPQATVDQVYSTAKASQYQIAAIRSNAALSAEDKASQIGAVSAQATASLTSILGDQNFQAYKDQAGYWLAVPTVSRSSPAAGVNRSP